MRARSGPGSRPGRPSVCEACACSPSIMRGAMPFCRRLAAQPGEPLAEHGGLSPLGKQAVTKLNDLGVLIDVSQLSTDALLQTLALSRAPVAATHSAARALVDNGRNPQRCRTRCDQGQWRRGAGDALHLSSTLPDAASRERFAAIRSARTASRSDYASTYDGSEALPEARRTAYLDEISAARSRRASSDFVDHIDYIAKRIGWQHVGIGHRFRSWCRRRPASTVLPRRPPERPRGELLRRGYRPRSRSRRSGAAISFASCCVLLKQAGSGEAVCKLKLFS